MASGSIADFSFNESAFWQISFKSIRPFDDSINMINPTLTLEDGVNQSDVALLKAYANSSRISVESTLGKCIALGTKKLSVAW